MSSEWAGRFKQFALAVDYVDESIVEEIKELLQRYFEETLDTCYFRLLMEGTGTETAYCRRWRPCGRAASRRPVM